MGKFIVIDCINDKSKIPIINKRFKTMGIHNSNRIIKDYFNEGTMLCLFWEDDYSGLSYSIRPEYYRKGGMYERGEKEIPLNKFIGSKIYLGGE